MFLQRHSRPCVASDYPRAMGSLLAKIWVRTSTAVSTCGEVPEPGARIQAALCISMYLLGGSADMPSLAICSEPGRFVASCAHHHCSRRRECCLGPATLGTVWLLDFCGCLDFARQPGDQPHVLTAGSDMAHCSVRLDSDFLTRLPGRDTLGTTLDDGRRRTRQY